MSESREIRVWLGDTECVLQPVTGMTLLRTQSERQAIPEQLRTDSGYQRLLAQATLVAEGVYVDGQRRFASVEEVLQQLTTTEIENVVSIYETELLNGASARKSPTVSAGQSEFGSFAEDATEEILQRTTKHVADMPSQTRLTTHQISDYLERDTRRYEHVFPQYVSQRGVLSCN